MLDESRYLDAARQAVGFLAEKLVGPNGWLLTQAKEVYDGAMPSGNSVAALGRSLCPARGQHIGTGNLLHGMAKPGS